MMITEKEAAKLIACSRPCLLLAAVCFGVPKPPSERA